MTGPTYDPATHYDRVTAAWTLLLGEELHYGVFGTGSEALPEATAELTARMLAAARIEPGSSLLDVGCGTGAPACRLARDTGARVTGITTSATGVEAARARAAAEGLSDTVGFEERDAMDNGFPDASFDRVWALESSHLMRDRDRMVAECARVLRPGGRFVLCDIVLRKQLDFQDVRRLRKPLALLRDVFGDARMEPMSEYDRLAGETGLKLEEQVDLTAPTRPTFAAWRANAERHGAEAAATLGEDGLRDFVEASHVLETMWDDGVLGYGLLCWSKP